MFQLLDGLQSFMSGMVLALLIAKHGKIESVLWICIVILWTVIFTKGIFSLKRRNKLKASYLVDFTKYGVQLKPLYIVLLLLAVFADLAVIAAVVWLFMQ